MADCKGIFGKCFGHKFHNFIVLNEPEGELSVTNCSGSDLEKVLDLAKIKKYEIRCKRCGAKADET